MSDAEIGQWVKLLQVGGNAGIIVLTIIAVKVAQAFLAELRGIKDEQTKTRVALTAGQEDIKRALVARDPQLAPMFERRPEG